MNSMKIGIIICQRYNSCAGSKCFRASRNRDRAFSINRKQHVEIVGYTTCDGCTGGNVEYAPEEIKKNGATVIHFTTGMFVGSPPCPHISYFRDFIRQKYSMDVVLGTHPIPQKYYSTHSKLQIWDTIEWKELIQPTLAADKTPLSYE